MKENEALLKCLEDIPRVVNSLILQKKDITEEFVKLFLSRDIKKIYFSGQASGIYIGMILKPFIEDCFQMEVQVTNPYEFVLNERFNVNGIYKPSQLCMICPAHSGTTPGPIKMAEICQEEEIAVVTVTYDLQSPLALQSTVAIDKRSGKEKSYIETRGHFASMVCIYLCFLEYGKASGRISAERYGVLLDCLKKVSCSMYHIVPKTFQWYNQNKKLLLDADVIRYIANGEYVGAALEGGLKIAETTHKSRLVYESEEFMHSGTTEVKRNSVIFMLMPENRAYVRMQELYGWCRQHSGRTIVLCSCENAKDFENALGVTLEDVPYFSAMEYILPFEVLAYLLSEDLGLSVITSANEDGYENLNIHINEGSV